MRSLLTAALASACLAAPLAANVGVFTGTGHTLALTSTSQVQLVSEEVSLVPQRGPYLFDGGTGGMDRVLFWCEFDLRNLTDEQVTIQVGFPLSSQFLQYGDEVDARELMASYGFLAQEEGRVHSPRFERVDKDQDYHAIFVWDMTFAPGEEKDLLVTYTLPMSMTLASTRARDEDGRRLPDGEGEKDWYEGLEGCLLEHTGYVTSTGKSWAGAIESATFHLRPAGFERYLAQRAPFGAPPDDEDAEGPLTYERSTYFRSVLPGGAMEDEDGTLTWTYTDYAAEHDLAVMYYVTFLPSCIADLERLLASDGATWKAAEDLVDLRDILAEYNGEATGNERIDTFVQRQVWYGQPIQVPIPDDVLAELERRIAAAG